MTEPNAIDVKNLTKVFKAGMGSRAVEALKCNSFSIPEGSVTGLLGPNGSGKSTFIKIATDFIRPTSGTLSFFGGKAFEEIKNEVGFVSEKPHYPAHFKGSEIVKVQSKLSGVGSDRASEVMGLVGISGALSRNFGSYSKGMRQRLAVGLSLLSDPRLLILDEPLSGLDPDGREALIKVIEVYSKQTSKTVLLSSHLLEDLQRICNNLVVLKEGEVVFSGDPTSVFEPESFRLKYRDGTSLIELFVKSSEVNETLKEIISKNYSILSVEPEMQSISYLYFKLIQTKGEV